MGRPRLTIERANNKLCDRPIVCLGPIDGYHTKSWWRCLICSQNWKSTPHCVILNNTGCYHCNLFSNKRLDRLLSDRNIKRCEDVKNARIKIEVQCTVCNYRWNTAPSWITGKNATGCPACAGKRRLTNDHIDNRLIEEHIPIKRIDGVVNGHTKILWQCTDNSKHKWKTTPIRVFQGSGCPRCYAKNGGRGIPTVVNDEWFRSRLESQMFEVLLEEFDRTEIERQKRYNSDTKHTCDFYIPKLKLWVEVSNFSTAEYLENIDKKALWIKEIGEHFEFVSRRKELLDTLQKYV